MGTKEKRVLNRRQQGDLGEVSAMEWLASKGAVLLIPFGHSPHFDLVAEVEGHLLRIQVKSSTMEERTPDGHQRYAVALATRGGNQSWSGVAKEIDPSKFDYLFVLTGQGRRWLIPSNAIEGKTSIALGGPKYAEYEVEAARPLRDAIFGEEPQLQSLSGWGEYPRGQRTATVNRQAQPSQVRLLPPPLASPQPVKPTNYERKPGQRGEAVINQKRRITLPQRPFFEAGFQNGSRVRVRSLGQGRIVIEQIELPEWARQGASDDEPAGPDDDADATDGEAAATDEAA